MKRLMDLVLVVLTVPVWFPLFILTWICVRWKLGTPVFFRQERAGSNGKPFLMIKFRTMQHLQNDSGEQLPDEARFTRVGWILRSCSLDELPQLWHVVRGEMSLVGPRPLPVAYLDRYSLEQARRLHVRPGLTGWAQVNGRNAVDWHVRFHLDTWYVDHQSVWLDLRILAKTIGTVLKRKGVSAPLKEFTGAPPDQLS